MHKQAQFWSNSSWNSLLHSEKSLQILPFLTIQCFHKIQKSKFSLPIWTLYEKMHSNVYKQAQFWSNVLELVFSILRNLFQFYLFLQCNIFTKFKNPNFHCHIWIQQKKQNKTKQKQKKNIQMFTNKPSFGPVVPKIALFFWKIFSNFTFSYNLMFSKTLRTPNFHCHLDSACIMHSDVNKHAQFWSS